MEDGFQVTLVMIEEGEAWQAGTIIRGSTRTRSVALCFYHLYYIPLEQKTRSDNC
jgi:hypothetical protein